MWGIKVATPLLVNITITWQFVTFKCVEQWANRITECFDHRLLHIFTDLSFCFWLKLRNLRTSKILDHAPKNKQGFGFTLQKDYGFINLKNVDLLFDYNFFHVPNR